LLTIMTTTFSFIRLRELTLKKEEIVL